MRKSERSNRSKGSKNHGKQSPTRQRRSGLQRLEDRCVLSITPPVLIDAQSTLVINGGDLDDTVVISQSADDATIVVQQYELSQRVTTEFPRSAISKIEFFGNGGDDRLTNRTDIATYAEGGEGNDTLVGGSGADVLDGGAGTDRLEGRLGNDRLLGRAGADTLHGNEGNDRLEGGEDHDLLYGHDGDDRLYGEQGVDTLEGAAGDDYLNGGLGDDRLNGGSDNDFMNGEAGNDRLVGGTGNDTALGGVGNDTLFGNDGNDRLEGGDNNDNLYGGAGDDRVYGQSGADYLEGSTGDDYLNGGSGNDRLSGGDGDDFLNGDAGDDRLTGHQGNDTLLGGAGDDVGFGNEGADRIDGGTDDDTLYGGEGNDLLYGRSGADRLEGEDGNDYLNGGSGNDTAYGQEGDDYLTGDVGDDRLEGGTEDDTLVGGAGVDVLLGDAGNDRLNGGSGNDRLLGAAGRDVMSGGGGDDQLLGGLGNDSAFGDAGSDVISGGDGDDYLSGGTGADRLEGDEGRDTLLGGADDDVLKGDDDDDRLFGGSGDDFLYGGNGNDSLHGDAGEDWLGGEAGNDSLHGGADADLLVGGFGDDNLVGDAGADRLEGDEGADLLLGGDGADSLVAGAGRDLLIGGNGKDTVLGSDGEDILIGASTAYDARLVSLREALAMWNSDLAYEQRVDHLSSHHSTVKLVPHETVFADHLDDTLVGGGDLDWFVLSAVNATYNPLGISMPHGGSGHHGGTHHDTILLDRPPVLEGFALIDSIDEVSDARPTEAIHSRMAHASHGSKLGEHLGLLQLVRYADVTHTATSSGSWNDPRTWEGGLVPSAGARVLVPIGAHVNIDTKVPQDIFSIRVDGTLSFSTTRDSELRVDTLVVTETGAFHMGTADQPVQAGTTARLLFTDNGPIDRRADPFGLGRGLITHGQVRLFGAEVTSFVAASGGLHAGDTTIRLATLPIGWSVGDQIAIAGTSVGGGQEEVRVIRGINGSTVTIDPLDRDHLPLESGLEVHIGNLSRNVVLESVATQDSRRGHTMFMHNRDVHISHAAFNGLGRTDKSELVTDPRVNDQWQLIGDTGNNPRARYAIHFHRNGVTADSAPATVHGSVVNGSPGWGFVNHSSYVDFTGNVSYGVDGAAYVAEAGDEIGRFDSNLALNTTGSATDVDSRVAQQDFGFGGEGFWLQGPGVSVTGNVVAGASGAAFMYYTRGLTVGGNEVRFVAENLDNPGIADGEETIRVIDTPIKLFKNNVGYSSDAGLVVRYNLRGADHSTKSVVSNSVFWNNRVGVDLPYAHNTLLHDLVVLVDPTTNTVNGVDNNAQTSGIVFHSLRIEGYQRGLHVPHKGINVVVGGSYVSKNANIAIKPADARGLQVLITGQPQFASVAGSTADDIAMVFQTSNAARNPNQVFFDMEVRLRYGPYSNHRLYFKQQDASAIPFPEAITGLPTAYVGLTQAELMDRFGIAVGGEIAPNSVEQEPGMLGLIALDRSTVPRQQAVAQNA